MSAERRLVSSPVRRSVKNPGDSRTRCANRSSPQLRDHPLGRRRQQIDLNEVEQRLDREERQQSKCDPVEQVAFAEMNAASSRCRTICGNASAECRR